MTSGDFDISGIGIYLNEYKKHLFSKAKFFIPKGIEYTKCSPKTG
jgi:hypothetical protein